jgi:hypothetical protein
MLALIDPSLITVIPGSVAGPQYDDRADFHRSAIRYHHGPVVPHDAPRQWSYSPHITLPQTRRSKTEPLKRKATLTHGYHDRNPLHVVETPASGFMIINRLEIIYACPRISIRRRAARCLQSIHPSDSLFLPSSPKRR